MNFVIITTAITRGNFHRRSIGKFYDLYWNVIKNMFNVHHIINLDLPHVLKNIYNKSFSIDLFKEIIPADVKLTLIDNPTPGFLQAYKNVVNKVTELNLNNNSFIWWFEDDWDSNFNPDFFNIIKLFNVNNPVAFNSVISSPLGSFRGGPIMTSSYFNKYFNLERLSVANNTCDPEKQVNRWLSGIDRVNGTQRIHRDISNDNKINIVYFYYGNNTINVNEYPMAYYANSSKFNQNIQFTYHAIHSNDLVSFEYGQVNNKQIELQPTNIQSILKNIESDGITYICIKPWLFSDIGREFNTSHSLQKWTQIGDGTTYIQPNFYNAQLGNWKLMDESTLRYKPSITMNKGFFSAIAYFHLCLPYLEQNYFNKDMKLNFLYYSHNYGNYPNFKVIGDLLQLNYIPSPNNKNIQFPELACLAGLSRNKNPFETDFKSAHDIFFKYFKFDISIKDEATLFCEQFKNKKVLGLHFRGTDKMKSKWVCHISDDEFIQIIEDHVAKNKYDIIFISTDENTFIAKMKQKLPTFNIIYYDEYKNEDNNNAIHLNQLSIIEKHINELKKNTSNLEKTKQLEDFIKQQTQINRFLLKNVIVNSFILSKCTLVLKTQSQVSAYSKVFNPDLQIYRVNSFKENYWPDSYIPLYNYENIENTHIKNLLQRTLR